jgi:hypothetical protein
MKELNSTKEENADISFGGAPFNARDFILNLSDDIALPEICGELYGDFSFEWIIGNKKRFSVSIQDKKIIAFASINKTEIDCGFFYNFEEFEKYLRNFLKE